MLSVAMRRMSRCFSEVIKTKEATPAVRNYTTLQFSKSRLVDFGQLPLGEIPDALMVRRPTMISTLNNKVTVAAEAWIAPTAAVTLTVKAGSRQQTLANSSVAQFVAHGSLLGTAKHSAEQIEQAIDLMSGRLTIDVGRELTTFTLSFDKDKYKEAVSLLAELVLRPKFDAVAHESLKDKIFKNAAPMDPFVLSVENMHACAYRDHYMGQPSHGNRDVVFSITPQQVKDYHSQFYVGENFVISVAGQVNPTKFTDHVNNEFGSAKDRIVGEVANTQKPHVTHSTMFIRDDEMYNTAFAVGFTAPSYTHPDYFAMQYFMRIIGEYRCDKYTGSNLNAAHLQNNLFHRFLGDRPGIYLHKPIYYAYSDTALFGNFIYGNEVFNHEMYLCTQNVLSSFAQEVAQVELFRARNKFWNQLLNDNDPEVVSRENNKNLTYLNRIVSRTEIARRISHMSTQHLEKVAGKWFYDQDIALAGYGNMHNLMVSAYYSRPVVKSTLGYYYQHRIHGSHYA